jgi:hypothetical protein
MLLARCRHSTRFVVWAGPLKSLRSVTVRRPSCALNRYVSQILNVARYPTSGRRRQRQPSPCSPQRADMGTSVVAFGCGSKAVVSVIPAPAHFPEIGFEPGHSLKDRAGRARPPSTASDSRPSERPSEARFDPFEEIWAGLLCCRMRLDHPDDTHSRLAAEFAPMRSRRFPP